LDAVPLQAARRTVLVDACNLFKGTLKGRLGLWLFPMLSK